MQGVASRFIFFEDFNQFLETDFWSLKTEFLEIGNFVIRPDSPYLFRREVKIDMWKYIRTIIMGLAAVWKEKLAHPQFRPCCLSINGDECDFY